MAVGMAGPTLLRPRCIQRTHSSNAPAVRPARGAAQSSGTLVRLLLGWTDSSAHSMRLGCVLGRKAR